ncbi:hypothetical protein PR048_008705 [Dryococelus australis]|uniref:Uncharacterized protein n=1 Tax=Dryococelus australis TaxID=614101 RepID=A0ABQ9HY86_9NEOP|nr:hypothetical protein PR048_008705 [Dryococelus australis]
MTIETKPMRSFKTNTGLTHGQGISDSVISKWFVEMRATHDICTSLEEFCGVLFSSFEQHADFSMTGITSTADSGKLEAWLDNHPPFLIMSEIMSIATGGVGECTINNCSETITIGKQAMGKIDGIPFSVAIDPFLPFQRISISKKTDDDLMMYLEYELAPLPLALLNESGTTKTNKSGMYTLFHTTKKDWNPSDFDIVVDGGFLMDNVIWLRVCTVSTICEANIKYVESHYPGRSCCVVFDGYTNSPNSTKATEQEQWYRMKKLSDINIDLNTEIIVKQDHFLSNEHNKSRLITLLKSQLNESGIDSRQAPGVADLLIVTTAIDKSKPLEKFTVVVIGEDVYLAVLLMAKTPLDRDILLVKPGQGKIKTNVYSTKEMEQLGLKDILFLHAFTDCDINLPAFRKGKVGFIQLYQENRDIHKVAEYGATASLNLHRYQAFVKSVAKIKPDISSLPRIEGAAIQNSYGTYHQVQQWLGNELSPELWGWANCSSDKCVCRKASLKCSPVCYNCHVNGLNCKLEDDDDDDEELELPPTLVEELDINMEENI